MLEETDFRDYFSTSSPVAVSTRAQAGWDAVGAGEDLFVLSRGDGAPYHFAGYWPSAEGRELVTCGQGPLLALYGTGARPIVSLDGAQCALGCDVGSPGRDVVWLVGDRATQSFTRRCATDFLKPRTAVQSTSGNRFVMAGAGFVRVEEIDADGVAILATRTIPDGITTVLGLFDDELSILAVRGRGAEQEIVEFDAFDGGVVPSRFALPRGFSVAQVFRPTPGVTVVEGWESGSVSTTLKRSTREANWTRTFEPGDAALSIAVSETAAVVLSLEPDDAGLADVWIQRFPL
ncbi:MAG: hypothetical protein ACOZQL_38085 [Myxococcota bacterium]